MMFKILLSISLLCCCGASGTQFLNIFELYDLLSSSSANASQDAISMLTDQHVAFVVPSSETDYQHYIGLRVCKDVGGKMKCLENGKVSYMGRYCENKNVTEDTVFNIGSISKLFGAAVLLRVLQDEPKYFPDNLDTKLRFYLPHLQKTFPDYAFIRNLDKRQNFEKMTMRDLVQHTSGIGNYNFGDKNKYNGDKGETEDSFCSNSVNDTEYGRFDYSNIGYNLIGMILKAITGKQYSQLLKQHVLVPLNLTQTFTVMDLENKADRIGLKQDAGNIRLAQSYSYYKGKLYFSKNFNWDGCVGGLFSSPTDLIKFAYNFYLNDGNVLFNEKTRRLRDISSVDTYTGNYYGIGQIYYANGWRGHTGGDMGLNAILAYDAKTNQSIAAMFTSESLTSTLADVLLAKGRVKDIPRDKTNDFYLSQRYKIVEHLRRSYSIKVLHAMHLFADRSPTLFYTLFNLNHYEKKNDEC